MKKKLLQLFSVLALCAVLILPQRAEAGFSGAGSLRAGDTVTVTFSVSGNGILGVEASLWYDGTLELLGTTQLTGWSMTQNGTNFLFLDSSASNPINGSANLFSAQFRVKNDVSPGTVVSAGVSASASEGSSKYDVSSSWSAEILAPLSGNADLSSLTCAEAPLGFDGGDEYYITVPYSVSSLSLDWSRAHSGSSAWSSGDEYLSVGSNTVTVTVEAENGRTKVYYIYVTREQDPNYVPSNDSALASLGVSVGQLSPAFAPEVTDYVVYVPYEVAEMTLSGSARDGKATGVQQLGGTALQEGETVLILECTAEDGTKTEYKVHAIRMPAYAGVLPEIIPPVKPEDKPVEPVEPVEPEPEPVPTLELPLVVALGEGFEVSLWVLVGAGIALVLLLVGLLCFFLGRKTGRKKMVNQLSTPYPQPTATPEDEEAREETIEAVNEEVDTSVMDEALDDEPAPAETADAPAAEESPAEEDAVTEAPAVESTASAEEVPEIPEAPAEAPAQELSEEEKVNTMSLSELLEDIKRM